MDFEYIAEDDFCHEECLVTDKAEKLRMELLMELLSFGASLKLLYRAQGLAVMLVSLNISLQLHKFSYVVHQIH